MAATMLRPSADMPAGVLRFGVAEDESQPTYSLTLDALEELDTFDSLFRDEGGRDGLARVVLEDSLGMSMAPEVDPAYLNLLRDAIRAQDRRAVVMLWDGMAPYSWNATLNWDKVWTQPMYEWLIFCVRRPRLVVWLLKQKRLLNTPTPPMVAAVMTVLYSPTIDLTNREFVSTEARLAKLPRDGHTWWHKLLKQMIKNLPGRPRQVWLHRPGTRPLRKSLLEVAVANAFQGSAKPVEDVCHYLHFDPPWLENAWNLMLSRGTMSGETMLAVSKRLYEAMLWHQQEPDAPTTQPGTAGRALRVAWCSLVEHSSGWERVSVCFNEKGAVWVPTQGNQGDDRHPDAFVAVLESMIEAHRTHRCELDPSLDVTPAASLAELSLVAFETAIKYPDRAHLAEDLAHLAFKESKLLDEGSAMKKAVYRLIARKMSHHPHPRVDKFAFVLMEEQREGGPPKIQQVWQKPVVDALCARIKANDRDAVRELVTTFGAALRDVATPGLLNLYIWHMCEPAARDVAKDLGEGPHRAWCEQKKRDLQQFLEVCAFDPDALATALRLAGEKGCGIGVEVLASPPYNARTPEDAPFVQCILQHLLAPGGAVAKQACEEFSKRQKVAP